MDTLQRRFPDEIQAAIARYPAGRQASAVISLLYLAQAAYGHLSKEAIEEVAGILAMDPTHVRGVAGFYTLFYERPHGGYVVQYCNDLPCALRGADDFLPLLEDALGCKSGQTSQDGLFTLECVMCLAACDRAPMMQVNLEYFHDLDAGSLAAIVADLRQRAAEDPPRRAPFGFGPPGEMGPAGQGGPLSATERAASAAGNGKPAADGAEPSNGAA